jgi:hypothetical protein
MAFRPESGGIIVRAMALLDKASDLFIYIDAFLNRKSLVRRTRRHRSRDTGLPTTVPSTQAST